MPWIGIVATFAMCSLFFFRADLPAGSPRATPPLDDTFAARSSADPRAKNRWCCPITRHRTHRTTRVGSPIVVLAPRLLAMISTFVRRTVAGDRLVEVLSSRLCSCLSYEAAANEPDVLAKHRTTPVCEFGTLAGGL